MLVFVYTEIVWTFLIWNLERLINLLSREFSISRCPLFLCTGSQRCRRASVRCIHGHTIIHKRCHVGRSTNFLFIYSRSRCYSCTSDILKILRYALWRFVACEVCLWAIYLCILFERSLINIAKSSSVSFAYDQNTFVR